MQLWNGPRRAFMRAGVDRGKVIARQRMRGGRVQQGSALLGEAAIGLRVRPGLTEQISSAAQSQDAVVLPRRLELRLSAESRKCR